MGEFRFTDPDEIRGWMRDKKRREFAERLELLAPPTPEELRILREEIDPSRAIIGRTAK